MSEALITYLKDHMAAAKSAVNLLAFMQDRHGDAPLGALAKEIGEEVEEDRELLGRLLDQLGEENRSKVKEVAAWLGEKGSHLKLRQSGRLGPLQSLETLALGILGKMTLWRTLASIAPNQSRLNSVDFARLEKRAESQYERVERFRMMEAEVVLVARSDGSPLGG